MTLRFHYDTEADAAYLRFSIDEIIESEEVSPGLVFDYGADGRIVGLEVMHAARRLPNDALFAE